MIASRVINGFGAALAGTPPTLDFLFESGSSGEIRHIVLISDSDAHDADLHWEIVHPATDYEAEQIIYQGKAEQLVANRRELYSPALGLTGYYRPLVFRVVEPPGEFGTPGFPATVKAITNLTIEIEYRPIEQYEIQGVSHDRS